MLGRAETEGRDADGREAAEGLDVDRGATDLGALDRGATDLPDDRGAVDLTDGAGVERIAGAPEPNPDDRPVTLPLGREPVRGAALKPDPELETEPRLRTVPRLP